MGRGKIASVPRVAVRTPTPGDQDAFIAAMRASRALHRPWISMPDTPEKYAAYVARAEDASSSRASPRAT
jgi:ribosomal-protein-alanine N-acetyltransferase